jgi:ornithine carbamoyltransferase
MKSMKGKSLVSVHDLSGEEVDQIITTAEYLKRQTKLGESHEILTGKTLAMIFEKPSLRTRVTFETGITQLGGHGIYLAPSDIQMGKREPVYDVARNLSRWVEGIMIRTFSNSIVVELAEEATVPVINGLSDLLHPCQSLTDFFTIYEKKGSLAGLALAYVGDGNNVCHSLMYTAAKVGTRMSVACPEGYEPEKSVEKQAEEDGLELTITHDPAKVVKNADVIYTDVWASMGQEKEKEKRLRIFRKYQVDMDLVKKAKPDVIVMHCLPAHYGEEITKEVIESPHSVVYDEAENRLHVQKAIMALTM